MDIKTAINNGYCIICENADDLRRLAPYFRRPLTEKDVQEEKFPCYAYAPHGKGVGFSSGSSFCDRALPTIHAKELSNN